VCVCVIYRKTLDTRNLEILVPDKNYWSLSHRRHLVAGGVLNWSELDGFVVTIIMKEFVDLMTERRVGSSWWLRLYCEGMVKGLKE